MKSTRTTKAAQRQIGTGTVLPGFNPLVISLSPYTVVNSQYPQPLYVHVNLETYDQATRIIKTKLNGLLPIYSSGSSYGMVIKDYDGSTLISQYNYNFLSNLANWDLNVRGLTRTLEVYAKSIPLANQTPGILSLTYAGIGNDVMTVQSAWAEGTCPLQNVYHPAPAICSDLTPIQNPPLLKLDLQQFYNKRDLVPVNALFGFVQFASFKIDMAYTDWAVADSPNVLILLIESQSGGTLLGTAYNRMVILDQTYNWSMDLSGVPIGPHVFWYQSNGFYYAAPYAGFGCPEEITGLRLRIAKFDSSNLYAGNRDLTLTLSGAVTVGLLGAQR